MTIGRYADAKFEYLSYCLKVYSLTGIASQSVLILSFDDTG